MTPFQPTGPILSFTAATTAPTSVQAVSLNKERQQQYCLTNVAAAIDAVVGWGQTDAEAKLNAAAGASVANCFLLMARTQKVITAQDKAFFSGITASSTAAISVQTGYGKAP